MSGRDLPASERVAGAILVVYLDFPAQLATFGQRTSAAVMSSGTSRFPWGRLFQPAAHEIQRLDIIAQGK